jgi:hypothetical protein
MERTAWTDERIDDSFAQVREELRELRAGYGHFGRTSPPSCGRSAARCSR